MTKKTRPRRRPPRPLLLRPEHRELLLHPPECRRLSVSEWADEYRVMDERTSATTDFQTSNNPAMKAVLDACGEPVVRIVTLRGARQVGKTSVAENALGTWIADRDLRGPVLWIEAIEKNISRPTFRLRVDSLFKSETVRERAPQDHDDRGTYKIVMRDMIVLFAWAGSQAAQSGDAMRYVIINELGIYRKHTKLHAVSIASKALKTYRALGTTKQIETSTPEEEGDLLDKEIKASDLRYCHVPCPHCGGYQVLVFKAEHATAQVNVSEVHWAEEAKRPAEITTDNVWYECIHCGERFDERHRAWMLEHSVWAREAPTVGGEQGFVAWAKERGWVRGAPGAGALPSGRDDLFEPYTEHVGFHFPCLVCAWSPWWETAREFVKAVRSGDVEELRNFVRFELAEPWREKGEAPKPNVVRRCIDPYRSRTVPAEADVLGVFLGVDVQELSIYYVIRAFGPAWRSWLLDAGEVARPLGKTSDLGPQLDDLIGASYADELTDDIYGVEFGFMDSQYDTNAVYDYCVRNRGRIAPARGGNREFAPYIKVGKLEPGQKGRDGKPRHLPGEVLVHTVNPWRFSEKLVHAMRQGKGSPAEWRLPSDIDEVDPRYLAQVTNQRRGRNERGIIVWKLVDTSVGDHYFDAEKMCVAAAMLKGIDRRRRPGPKPPAPSTSPVITRRGFRRKY